MWALAALWVAAPLAQTSTPTWVDRFAGSRVSVEVATTAATLWPDLQLSDNPYLSTGLLLAPRFRLAESWSASAQLGVTVEWTNSDTTDRRREPELTDLGLAVRFDGLPELWGVRSSARLSAQLPLSEASRAATLVIAPAVGLSASRAFAVGGGQLEVWAGADYRRLFHTHTTPGVDSPRAYSPQCFGGGVGCADQLTGVVNARDVVSWSVDLRGTWAGLTPAVSWRMSHVVPYALSRLEGVGGVEDPTRLRVLTYFGAQLGYALTEQVEVELGYQLARNLLAGDGRIGNPLFDRYQDVRLHAGVSYTLP